MQLFYDRNFSGINTSELSPAQSHHCINVMRMGVDDQVWISDGCGNLYRCRIVHPHAKHCMVELVEHQFSPPTRGYTLCVAVAPTKNIDRTEWLIEKATEIGIDSFTPLLCDRSERKTVNAERLQRIVESAAAQSQKSWLPTLNPMTPLRDFITNNRGGLIAHCAEGYKKTSLRADRKDYTILIGPEGDFSPAELEAALAAGYEYLSLGRERLRTETAALYSVAAISALNNVL